MTNAKTLTAYELMIKRLEKDGYELVEVYSEDEADETLYYQWATYDRKGTVFTTEEAAWLEADKDNIMMADEE